MWPRRAPHFHGSSTNSSSSCSNSGNSSSSIGGSGGSSSNNDGDSGRGDGGNHQSQYHNIGVSNELHAQKCNVVLLVVLAAGKPTLILCYL